MNDEIIIERGRTEKNYWKDLWKYRELFYILSWRDVKVRYKQTLIGIAWSLIRPLLTMIIFTVVFNYVAKVPSGVSAPYAIMVYAAMLPWTFFSNSLSDAGNSLISNANLISKVYFPRLIIPTASIFTNLVDFIISFLLLFILFLWFRYTPGWQLVLLPLFLLMAFLTSIGVGLFVTALNVKFRDFKFIVPFIIQFGMYISPVGFNSNIIPAQWRFLFYLNPMATVIDGFRWCILNGEQVLSIQSIFTSLFVIITFLFLGIRRFRKMEKSFADLI